MFGLSGFKEVDPAYVAEITTQGAHLIDVRTEAELAQGVIDGAIHIPLHLLPLRTADIPQDKPVVIYCRSGARSAQACAFMAARGYRNMHNLAGGIMAWARSGNALAQLR
ncbi:MAG: rhodanese-like domain-containing protein [Rhodocyclaceae bacterium]|jgi:rhodanese-related sulfurtransferase|nr:rhodanese-like domain-containing protein [Rhodocyclaceae bacterium]